jgi:hypothetical protein
MEESPISVVKVEVFSPALNQVCVYEHVAIILLSFLSVLIVGVAPGHCIGSEVGVIVAYGPITCIFNLIDSASTS